MPFVSLRQRHLCDIKKLWLQARRYLAQLPPWFAARQCNSIILELPAVPTAQEPSVKPGGAAGPLQTELTAFKYGPARYHESAVIAIFTGPHTDDVAAAAAVLVSVLFVWMAGESSVFSGAAADGGTYAGGGSGPPGGAAPGVPPIWGRGGGPAEGCRKISVTASTVVSDVPTGLNDLTAFRENTSSRAA